MDIAEETSGHTLILTPKGRIDGSAEVDLEQALRDRITEDTTAVVIDLSAVDYINSAGLRVLLIGARKIQAAEGSLALCALAPHVLKVFEVSGFNKILQIFHERAEAIAALS